MYARLGQGRLRVATPFLSPAIAASVRTSVMPTAGVVTLVNWSARQTSLVLTLVSALSPSKVSVLWRRSLRQSSKSVTINNTSVVTTYKSLSDLPELISLTFRRLQRQIRSYLSYWHDVGRTTLFKRLSVGQIHVALCGRFAEITIYVRRAFYFRCFEGRSRCMYALDLDVRPTTVLALPGNVPSSP